MKIKQFLNLSSGALCATLSRQVYLQHLKRRFFEYRNEGLITEIFDLSDTAINKACSGKYGNRLTHSYSKPCKIAVCNF